jgi:hypothetical protein
MAMSRPPVAARWWGTTTPKTAIFIPIVVTTSNSAWSVNYSVYLTFPFGAAKYRTIEFPVSKRYRSSIDPQSIGLKLYDRFLQYPVFWGPRHKPPSRSRVLCQELTVRSPTQISRLLWKFMFITVFTTAL